MLTKYVVFYVCVAAVRSSFNQAGAIIFIQHKSHKMNKDKQSLFFFNK